MSLRKEFWPVQKLLHIATRVTVVKSFILIFDVATTIYVFLAKIIIAILIQLLLL